MVLIYRKSGGDVLQLVRLGSHSELGLCKVDSYDAAYLIVADFREQGNNGAGLRLSSVALENIGVLAHIS